MSLPDSRPRPSSAGETVAVPAGHVGAGGSIAGISAAPVAPTPAGDDGTDGADGNGTGAEEPRVHWLAADHRRRVQHDEQDAQASRHP